MLLPSLHFYPSHFPFFVFLCYTVYTQSQPLQGFPFTPPNACSVHRHVTRFSSMHEQQRCNGSKIPPWGGHFCFKTSSSHFRPLILGKLHFCSQTHVEPNTLVTKTRWVLGVSIYGSLPPFISFFFLTQNLIYSTAADITVSAALCHTLKKKQHTLRFMNSRGCQLLSPPLR